MNLQDAVSLHLGWVGLLTGMVFAGLDALINVNPLAQRIYAPYRPIMRSAANAGLGVTFDMIAGFVMAILFLVLTPALPAGWVAKGIAFGLIAWFFRVVMGAASHAVIFEVPMTASLYTVVTGLGEMVCLGLLYGAFLRPR